MKLNLSSYWQDLLERAARTFVQAELAALGLTAATTDFQHLPWEKATQYALGTTIVSILMSFGGAFSGDPKTASFLPTPANGAADDSATQQGDPQV